MDNTYSSSEGVLDSTSSGNCGIEKQSRNILKYFQDFNVENEAVLICLANSQQTFGRSYIPNSLSKPNLPFSYEPHLNSEEYTDELRSFYSLGDDWDGDGAKAIPHSAIKHAIDFLNPLLEEDLIISQLEVAPSPDGEIVFYWGSGENYIEINFDDHSRTLCFREDDQIYAIEDEISSECDMKESQTFNGLLKQLKEK